VARKANEDTAVFDSPIVDVAIGLIVVYLVLSIVCSAMQEWWASVMNLRAKNLEEGIKNLVGNPIAQAIYEHGLVKGLAKPGSKPSYLASRDFTSTLIDVIATEYADGKIDQLEHNLEATLSKITEQNIRRALLALSAEGKHDLEKFKSRVSAWFDQAMDRVSGWYTKRAKLIGAIVAALVVIVVNADSVKLARAIWTNGTLRQQLVGIGAEIGQKTANGNDTAAAQQKLEGQAAEILGSLPIGWPCKGTKPDIGEVCILSGNFGISSIPGWIITMAAVSFGAPFWFDLLGRITRVRGAGRKPERHQSSQ